MSWKSKNIIYSCHKLCFFVIHLILLSTLHVPEGEVLLKLPCCPYHAIAQGKLIGPDLANIAENRDEDWIKSSFRSSQSLINIGNTAAVAWYEEYNKIHIPDQVSPTDLQIDTILAYNKTASITPKPQADVLLKI